MQRHDGGLFQPADQRRRHHRHSRRRAPWLYNHSRSRDVPERAARPEKGSPARLRQSRAREKVEVSVRQGNEPERHNEEHKRREEKLILFFLLTNGRWAVIDRTYSVDSATVGAVYDRPTIPTSLCIGDYAVVPSPRSLPNNTFLRARNSPHRRGPARSGYIGSRACRDRRF